jgi:hypothetical protein
MFNFNFSDLDIAQLLQNAGITSGSNPAVATTTSASGNQITRYIRHNEVLLIADSLCPDKVANVFFDSTLINNYCQVGNRLNLYPANNAGIFDSNEGIVNLSTNCYARVIGTSNNIVYLNQNYITVNVATYGVTTLSSSSYAKDDIIFQNNSIGQRVFEGKVEYFDVNALVMAIAPTSGTLVANTSAEEARVLRKVNSAVLANVTSIKVGNQFPVNSTIRSTSNVSKVGLVNSFLHSSGSYLRSNTSNPSNLVVYGDAYGALGQTVNITYGTGFSTERTVTAVLANNELVLNSAFPTLTSNSRYTFGPRVIDDFGKFCGIFDIPETETVNFQAGNRIVTITDAAQPSNTEYLMKASSAYRVTGAPVYIPPPPPRRIDPLAQTFFTPDAEQVINGVTSLNYGIYISSIDLFFSAKPILADLQFPVTVQIVSVDNGLPTQKVIAAKTVDCKNVNISVVPDINDASTKTKFTFDDPIFLEPTTEYAIVVLSNSPDYSVFVSELGGEILGAFPPRRVSQQPYVGSLFKSQNASTWTPIQNQDLMFRINKCVFATNQTGSVFFNPYNVSSNVEMDYVLVHTTEENHKPTSSQYKFKATNVLGTVDPSYTYLPTNSSYGFGADLLISTKTSNRRRVITAGDSTSFDLGVEMTSADPDMSPVVNIERLSMLGYKNYINNASLSNTDVSVLTFGNHISAANIIVSISPPDLSDGVTANAYVSSLSGNSINTIIFDQAGSGYITNPTITFREFNASVNATAVIIGETSALGGNAKSRYVTKQITLADGFDAGDLRVYVDCNRPQGTNIHVYYKVMSASDTDNFNSKKWQLMRKVTDQYSLDQSQIVEIEYRPSLTLNAISYVENGITYPIGGKFKYFAIKVVLTAEDTTVVPSLRNFRAIATPAG